MNIVIVGCGNVGLETARLLVRDHRLLLVNRTLSEDVNSFVADYPNATFVRADATDLASIEKALAPSANRFRRVDVLVSTVGTAAMASMLEDFEGYRDDFNANLFGNLIPIKVIGKQMIAQRGGKIVVISSTSGVHAYPGWGAYAASKWALTNLCRTLRQEVKPHGISVDIVFPRTIKNERSKTFLNRTGLEPCEVACQIVKVLAGPNGTDRFIPRRHELLRSLERLFPQLLDKKAGLRRERRAHFSARPIQSVLFNGVNSSLALELARRYATTAERLYLLGPDLRRLSTIGEDIERASSCTVQTIPTGDSRSSLCDSIIDLTGCVDLIVNCEDPSVTGELVEAPLDLCAENLASSFLRPMRLLAAYLKNRMLPHGMVNVLFTPAAVGCPRYGAFFSGQAALWAQTRAMRRTVGNEVQVMEALLPGEVGLSNNGQPVDADMVSEAARRIHEAQQQGKEIVVFPLRTRMSAYLNAICPRVSA